MRQIAIWVGGALLIAVPFAVMAVLIVLVVAIWQRRSFSETARATVTVFVDAMGTIISGL
jgi:hypothetical protein